MRRGWIVAIVLLIVAAGAAAVEQDFFGEVPAAALDGSDNHPYDGKVTFARIRYAADFGGFWRRRDVVPGWAHDYPTADTHVMKIINELTLLRPRIDGSNIFSSYNPELNNYPITYMSEPVSWITDNDATRGLRNYLLKGGLIIFDDFGEYN